MTKTLIEKAKSILEGLEYGYFDTAKEWSKDNYDDYYHYFSHPNFEFRKYSLLVFTAGLGNWYSKSAFIFEPIEELKKDPEFHPDTVYYFENYVRAFLDNREAIKRDFPKLYRMIVLYLIKLDNRENFKELFCSVDKKIFVELRQVLNDSGLGEELIYNKFHTFLKELGLPNYAGNEL